MDFHERMGAVDGGFVTANRPYLDPAYPPSQQTIISETPFLCKYKFYHILKICSKNVGTPRGD